MDGWMDGWNGWMDGWNGWMDGMDGWMKWMDGWMNEWLDFYRAFFFGLYAVRILQELFSFTL